MEKIQNVLMKYLMPIANKLEQQKHIQAIKDGIVASIPIIIVGSFCTIFLGIANLLGSGPVYDFFKCKHGGLDICISIHKRYACGICDILYCEDFI